MGVKKVGVLATDGTIESGIYEKSLRKQGIEVIYPSSENQKFIMKLIYDYIKSGRDDYDDSKLREILEELKEKGAEKIILGCTELPIAFERLGENEDLVDPTLILAYSAVYFAGARLNVKVG
ncbi:MAG: aspartate/glutamate racemase family protein, partial [Intestinibacter sp.]